MDIKIDGLKYEIMGSIGKLVMVVYILGKLIETFASQKKMLKLMLKIITEEF
jgi:hypothetical protein